MTFTSEMQSFLAPLEALQKLIEKFDNRGVVIGGIASSLLGKARLTADLDVMILLSINDIPDLIREAENAGLEMRIDKADEFARKNRVLLLRHRDNATNIDITLGNLPFEEEVVERSQLVNIGKISIRLPTVEDLIIMKAVAHRAKDILDIQGVVDANPDLDKQRIEYWLRQFAEALESPEIWLDVEKLLQD
jgi:predicted nucleotidyltransferase